MICAPPRRQPTPITRFPLAASVIGEAIDLVWLAGGIALAVAASLSALLVWGVGG